MSTKKEKMAEELKKLNAPLNMYELERLRARTETVVDKLEHVKDLVPVCGSQRPMAPELDAVRKVFADVNDCISTIEALLQTLKNKLPSYSAKLIKLAKEYSSLHAQEQIDWRKKSIADLQKDIEKFKKQIS